MDTAIKSKFRLGQLVQVKLGASIWMKHHNYWISSLPPDLDGKRGTIVADYTNLNGNDSHYGIDFGDGEIVGINPMWLC